MNSNNMNINPKNLEALLNTVSKKLGTSPDSLKKDLENGKFDNAMKNMNSNESAVFQKVLSNPQLLEKFMTAPQAQALYKKITGQK